MNKDDRDFHLVNLKERADVIQRINDAESELRELLDAPVALIAYVQSAAALTEDEGR